MTEPFDVDEMLDNLPEATPSPCNDCPWRRDSTRGWLGPFGIDEWISIIHSDAPVACHQTLHKDDEWNSPGVKQCKGAAIFRANVFKSPRHPNVATASQDKDTVFATNVEFREHHDSPLQTHLHKVRSGVTLGNRRSRCKRCNVVIGSAGGPWVDVETLDSCCALEDGERRPHEPTSSRWKVMQ